MKQSTVEQLANFSDKSGQIIAAIIREQPECVSTVTFKEFVVVVMKFANAIANDPHTTIKGSETYEEFYRAKQEAVSFLMGEEQ